MATIRTRIGPADNGRKMTLEEFWDAEGQPGYLYELARGVLEVTQVPGEPHYQVVDNLHEGVSATGRQHPERDPPDRPGKRMSSTLGSRD